MDNESKIWWIVTIELKWLNPDFESLKQSTDSEQVHDDDYVLVSRSFFKTAIANEMQKAMTMSLLV